MPPGAAARMPRRLARWRTAAPGGQGEPGMATQRRSPHSSPEAGAFFADLKRVIERTTPATNELRTSHAGFRRSIRRFSWRNVFFRGAAGFLRTWDLRNRQRFRCRCKFDDRSNEQKTTPNFRPLCRNLSDPARPFHAHRRPGSGKPRRTTIRSAWTSDFLTLPTSCIDSNKKAVQNLAITWR